MLTSTPGPFGSSARWNRPAQGYGSRHRRRGTGGGRSQSRRRQWQSLRAHRLAQQEQRLALGLGKAPDDALVFAGVDGQARKPNALTNEWIIATSAIGGRFQPNALRHTHASSLIAAGIDILTISRRLGHAKPAVTLNVYGHLYASTDDRAAQVIEAMFSRVRD